MTDDLTDVAGGDSPREQVLRSHLAQLAAGNDATLREMARAVLAGELRLRDAALSDAYGPAFGDAFGTFWTHYRNLTPEERDQLSAVGRHHLDQADQRPPFVP